MNRHKSCTLHPLKFPETPQPRQGRIVPCESRFTSSCLDSELHSRSFLKDKAVLWFVFGSWGQGCSALELIALTLCAQRRITGYSVLGESREPLTAYPCKQQVCLPVAVQALSLVVVVVVVVLVVVVAAEVIVEVALVVVVSGSSSRRSCRSSSSSSSRSSRSRSSSSRSRSSSSSSSSRSRSRSSSSSSSSGSSSSSSK